VSRPENQILRINLSFFWVVEPAALSNTSVDQMLERGVLICFELRGVTSTVRGDEFEDVTNVEMRRMLT